MLVGVNDDTCYNCGRRNPGLWGFTGVIRTLGRDMGIVPLIIGPCVILWGLELLFSSATGGMGAGGGLFSLLSPSLTASVVFGASGAVPVFGMGRWWTVLSAAWLHAGLLHIGFNMLAVRQLAPGTVELYGPARTMIIYVVAGVAGFALSSFAGAYIPGFLFLQGGRFTLGASASIAGLIGALLHYGHRGGSGLARSYATSYIISLVMFGALVPGIDNYAHAGGFAGGYLAAKILDPLKRERGDHLIIAIVLLVVSAAAVLYSILTGLRLLP